MDMATGGLFERKYVLPVALYGDDRPAFQPGTVARPRVLQHLHLAIHRVFDPERAVLIENRNAVFGEDVART